MSRSFTAWYIVKERLSKGVCTHGAQGCLCHYELYFDGEEWDMARHNSLKYSTKEEAESAAFLLVVNQGEEIGKVVVKEMLWEPDNE